MIWSCAGLGALYSLLAALSFFHIMDHAINDEYMTRAYRGRSKLDLVHGGMPVVIVGMCASSTLLWWLCSRRSEDEWIAWWYEDEMSSVVQDLH